MILAATKFIDTICLHTRDVTLYCTLLHLPYIMDCKALWLSILAYNSCKDKYFLTCEKFGVLWISCVPPMSDAHWWSIGQKITCWLQILGKITNRVIGDSSVSMRWLQKLNWCELNALLDDACRHFDIESQCYYWWKKQLDHVLNWASSNMRKISGCPNLLAPLNDLLLRYVFELCEQGMNHVPWGIRFESHFCTKSNGTKSLNVYR